MSLAKKFFLIIALALLNATLTADPEFISLEPRTPTPFSLTNDDREAYFSFNNKDKEGDVYLHFAKGYVSTVDIYIYYNKSQIKKDDEGTYIQSNIHLRLENRNEYIINEYTAPSDQMYIIIKDLKKYYYKDYIEVFNENDPIQVEFGKTITIDKLFSSQSVLLAFNCDNKNKRYEFILSNEDSENEHTVTAYDSNNVTFFTDTSININRIINENRNSSGKFYVKIACEDEIYIGKKLVMINEMNSEFYATNLKPGERKYFEFINSRYFNFYADIENYSDREENIITFNFDYNTVKNNLVEGIYCTYVNYDPKKTDELVDLMPRTKGENLCPLKRADEFDNYFHLYIKKREEFNEPETDYFVLVSVDLNVIDFIQTPGKLNVVLSERSSFLDLDQVEAKSENFFLKDYVPRVFKYKLPQKKNQVYIIFSTAYGMQTNILGNLTITRINEKGEQYDAINDDVNQIQLFAITNVKVLKRYTFCVIKIFGAGQTVQLNIEQVNAELMYFNSFRPTNTLTIEKKDTGHPLLIVGAYLKKERAFSIIEELYGNFTIKVKKDLRLDPVYQHLVPDDGDIVDKNVVSLENRFDIILIDNKLPGLLKMHFIDQERDTEIERDARKIFRLIKANHYAVKLPAIENESEDFLLSFEAPFSNNDIVVTFDNQDISITGDNNTYKTQEITLHKDKIDYIKMISNNQDTILYITLKSKNIMKKITSDQTQINYKNIYIPLKKENTYSQVIINITSAYNDFYYQVGRYNPDDEKFDVPVPTATDGIFFDVYSKTFYEMGIENPYDKYNSSDRNYYFGISFIEDPFDIEPIKKYNIKIKYVDKEKVPIAKPGTISLLSTSGGMKVGYQKVQLEHYEVDEKKKYYFINKNCLATITRIDAYYYHNFLSSMRILNTFTVNYLDNFYSDIQIKPNYLRTPNLDGPYNGMLINYLYTDKKIVQSDIDKFNDRKKLIEGKVVKYDSSKSKFTWSALEGIKKYEVYILKTTDEVKNYSLNDCFLLNRKGKIDLNGDEVIATTDKTEISFTYGEKVSYTISIVAIVEEPMTFRFNYLSLERDWQDGDKTKKKNLKGLYIFLGCLGGLIFIVLLFFIINKIASRRRVIIPSTTIPLYGEKLADINPSDV